MTVRLYKLNDHPTKVAVSKTEALVVGGAFFLDFSRPLQIYRWFAVPNRWIGIVVGLAVPVIHQGEGKGAFVIGVRRADPGYSTVRALWKARYPSNDIERSSVVGGLKIAADFAAQFPDDCS